MFTFFCLFVLVTLNITAGEALLSCYGCIASTDSDCYRGVKPSFFHQQCNQNTVSDQSMLKALLPNTLNKAVPIETVCIDFVLSDYSPKIVERGCGYIYEGVDICQFLNWTANIDSCSYCRSDMCNSNPIIAL